MVFIQLKWLLSCLNVLQMDERMEEYFVKWLDVLVVKNLMEMALGEHGGSRDVQGFDKGMEGCKMGEMVWKIWTELKLPQMDGQQSANRLLTHG